MVLIRTKPELPEPYDEAKAEAEAAKARNLEEQGYDPYFYPVAERDSPGSGTKGNVPPEHETRAAKGDLPADPPKTAPQLAAPFVMDD